MKAAIDLRRARPAFIKNAALSRRSQRKLQRLTLRDTLVLWTGARVARIVAMQIRPFFHLRDDSVGLAGRRCGLRQDSWTLDRKCEVATAQGSQAIASAVSASKEIRTVGESRTRQPLSGARRELLVLGEIYVK